MLFLSEKYAWRLRKMKYERNALIQSIMNNLPLPRQFALTAVKLQMFCGKTRHVWHPIRTRFFVSCSRLDATDGIPRFWVATPAAARAKIGLKWMTNILQLAIKGNELTNQTKRYLMDDTWQLFSTKNWWARGLLSVPKKLGTLSRSNGTWNFGFRGEGKPQISENNLSQSLSQSLSISPSHFNRPIRLTQCCTQFKSPGVKILRVLYLHYNVAFTFKWYGNSWNKTFYPQRVWIGTTFS